MKNQPVGHTRGELCRPGRRTLRKLLPLEVAALVVGIGCAFAVQLLPLSDWMHGFEVGLVAAGLLGAIAWSILMGTGRHSAYLGRLGVESTAECVHGVWPRLRGWHVINGPCLKGDGDVDHILVGPAGIFALESKWTNVPWAINGDMIEGPEKSPTAQARRGARKVAGTLRSGRVRLDVPVIPVVVLWGPGAPMIDGGSTTVDGVLVAEGRRRGDWVQHLEGDSLPRDVVEAVATKLSREQASRVEPRTTDHSEPAPVGVHALL